MQQPQSVLFFQNNFIEGLPILYVFSSMLTKLRFHVFFALSLSIFSASLATYIP